MKNKVTLYIATHNTTGLKYFGKTIRYFTQELLQEKYHGSGVDWNKHLLENNDDVTMEIYGIYSLDEVENKALTFSLVNDIVKSKLWANMVLEDGIGGGTPGRVCSEETRKKMSISAFNMSEETKKKIGLAHKGKIVSEETKAKLRKSKENISDEIRKNMSLAHIGIQAGSKNPMYGKTHTEESKLQISKTKQNLCIFEGKEITIQERGNIKLSRTTKGTELGRLKSQKSADTVALKNPWYNIYHIDNGLVQENVPQKDLRKISQTLKNTTKEKYMGKSNQSKSSLIKQGKEKLIGLYVKEIECPAG
jgi:hypothetical protein